MSTGQTYQLYGRQNAGSLAPQMVLEEIGAAYERHWVGTDAAALEAYRRINPAGKVPALILPDGTAIAESAAIVIHLTLAHPAAGLAPQPGSTAHARFLQWMLFLSANVYEAVLRCYYPERFSTAGTAAAAPIKAQGVADFVRHLELIHGALSPYVLGEKYSAADPYLHMLAGWYTGDAAELHKGMPKLARHAELLRQRPAVRKAEADHA
ncbi:MAG TPA: glutathione S-transferase family protein [Steroidobacteraceae bacterium]|nr:glutathione S-transferase family protein [Steroidobacteraceae bacterium]